MSTRSRKIIFGGEFLPFIKLSYVKTQFSWENRKGREKFGNKKRFEDDITIDINIKHD
jgi:hypothetical protein